MKDFEQLPSAQMSASARMDELSSLLACALIRSFVSSQASQAADETMAPQNESDKVDHPVGAQCNGPGSGKHWRDHNRQSSPRA